MLLNNDSRIIGRLTAAPELRKTDRGISVCRFTVAVSRPYKKDSPEREADFIDCVAWREKAEFLCRNFTKGQGIAVQGHLQTSSWTDNNGSRHKKIELTADEIGFYGSKPQKEQDCSYTDIPDNLLCREDLPF